MLNRASLADKRTHDQNQSEKLPTSRIREVDFAALPAKITRAASKQTYYTIRFLVDHDRVIDAFRAYGYFRWLDDWLDLKTSDRCERIGFVGCQQALVDCCYQGQWPRHVSDEEHILVELIRGDQEQNSGLQLYIRDMMKVMAFDAERRGKLISQAELTEYSRHLSTAVTEALHYFIGHGQPSPRTEARYLAATAAHITHMLRDTFEDVAAGYFNIPGEILDARGINPHAPDSDPYRSWVKSRVQLARDYFKAGKAYLAQVKNLRCRAAGHLYIARFERVLDVIERDGYRLRASYQECKGLRATLRTGLSLFAESMRSPF